MAVATSGIGDESTVHTEDTVADLVTYIYREAVDWLERVLDGTVGPGGIVTPIGALTLDQVEKGEALLSEAYKRFQVLDPTQVAGDHMLTSLTADFYASIPHKMYGRAVLLATCLVDVEARKHPPTPPPQSQTSNRFSYLPSVKCSNAPLHDPETFKTKEELIGVMKNLLAISEGQGAAAVTDSTIDAQYQALNCSISALDRSSPDFKAVVDFVHQAQV